MKKLLNTRINLKNFLTPTKQLEPDCFNDTINYNNLDFDKRMDLTKFLPPTKQLEKEAPSTKKLKTKNKPIKKKFVLGLPTIEEVNSNTTEESIQLKH